LAGPAQNALQKGGFLAIFLVAPLLAPILIFGVMAAENFIAVGWAATELRVLAGLSLLSLAVSIPASAAALFANVE
jgi:heme exporter protein CcmB